MAIVQYVNQAPSSLWDKKMFYGASPLWNGEGSVAVFTPPFFFFFITLESRVM